MAAGHNESKLLKLIMQKESQPNQTCPEGCTLLFRYVTGVFLCIWGVLQVVAGIKKAEKRPTPLFLNRISVLQYKKDFNF